MRPRISIGWRPENRGLFGIAMPQKQSLSLTLTVPEVARYPRVHPMTIYRLLRQKRIPTLRVAHNWKSLDQRSADKCRDYTVWALRRVASYKRRSARYEFKRGGVRQARKLHACGRRRQTRAVRLADRAVRCDGHLATAEAGSTTRRPLASIAVNRIATRSAPER
jgi:excisionase family DNA binding protein